MKGIKEDTSSVEGQSVRHLAERWGLPYREAHTLSIDPAALEIVDREESRRLRVLPLEIGGDGPVFAVAEPSEERFSDVREIAGDNATFVLVAQETLDALLNSKVFSVPNTVRRPSLFRGRTDLPPGEPTQSESSDPDARGDAPSADATPAQGDEERANDEHSNESHENHQETEVSETTQKPPSFEGSAESAEALENLFSQIASGAGTLRAQVNELAASLEAAQHELRQAKQELAEAHKLAESHGEVVDGLEAEIRTLKDQLAGSTAVNNTMTARLEEVARALMDPSSGSPGG